MNTTRRCAADDAHVIDGTACDESLGEQLCTGTDNLPMLNQPVQPTQVGGTDDTGPNTPGVSRHARTQATAKVEALSSNGMDDIEIPVFLRNQAD